MYMKKIFRILFFFFELIYHINHTHKHQFITSKKRLLSRLYPFFLLTMQIKKFWKFTFVCSCRGNRSWFVHECTMFNENNVELESSKCQYYNRTREPRTYYTAIRDCLRSYRRELIDRKIEDYKRENNKKRLFQAQKCRITELFEETEIWRQIKQAFDETENYHSCR